MIHNEEAYYTGYYRNVRAMGAIPALVFDTICGLLRNNESGEIANKTLREFLGCTKPTLNNAVKALEVNGYILCKTGVGRGNSSIYALTEKGKENCPFMDEKRERNFTEKVKKFYGKGKEILPINKELNKELKESGGDMHASEQSHTLSNTTPLNFENMEDFNEFWKLYCNNQEWSSEKENCERVWFTMSQEWRDRLIQQLRDGKRWRVRENDNPYWYLKNYNGEIINVELPFVRNGSTQIEKWIRSGKKVCVMLYKGDLDEERTAYCLSEDQERMENAGAKFIRYM